jgi:hypothetical protein
MSAASTPRIKAYQGGGICATESLPTAHNKTLWQATTPPETHHAYPGWKLMVTCSLKIQLNTPSIHTQCALYQRRAKTQARTAAYKIVATYITTSPPCDNMSCYERDSNTPTQNPSAKPRRHGRFWEGRAARDPITHT